MGPTATTIKSAHVAIECGFCLGGSLQKDEQGATGEAREDVREVVRLLLE